MVVIFAIVANVKIAQGDHTEVLMASWKIILLKPEQMDAIGQRTLTPAAFGNIWNNPTIHEIPFAPVGRDFSFFRVAELDTSDCTSTAGISVPSANENSN